MAEGPPWLPAWHPWPWPACSPQKIPNRKYCRNLVILDVSGPECDEVGDWCLEQGGNAKSCPVR